MIVVIFLKDPNFQSHSLAFCLIVAKLALESYNSADLLSVSNVMEHLRNLIWPLLQNERSLLENLLRF